MLKEIVSRITRNYLHWIRSERDALTQAISQPIDFSRLKINLFQVVRDLEKNYNSQVQ